MTDAQGNASPTGLSAGGPAPGGPAPAGPTTPGTAARNGNARDAEIACGAHAGAAEDGPPNAGGLDFRAVFEAGPGNLLVLAADAPHFTMIAATDERLASTRTTREATLGRPLFAVFSDANPSNPSPSGVANLRASLETVLRTRRPHRMAVQRYDLRRPDGTWEERYWAPHNVPVLGPDGAVRYLVHGVEDVTDVVRERAATATAERRAAELQAVLESMSDAVYIGGPDGITLANQAALDQLGFATREELNRAIGTLAAEIQTRDPGTGEFIPVERQAFTRALGGERVVQDVLVRHRTAGDDRVVRCAAAPVVVDGRVVAAVAVNTDVTEIRQAATERERLLAELGAERERLRTLILQMPAPVALHLGPEHRYALVNDAYRRVSGTHRALDGRTPRELFPEVAATGVFEVFDRVYATGEPWDAPEVLLPFDRNGTGRVEDAWFRVRCEPVRDAEGRVVGILNFSLEITDQVVARCAVEAHAQALAVKTAELEANQDRLRLALDVAGMAFWDFDPKTNRTIRSEHHDRLYGHAEPLAVWNFDVYLAHVHPDDRAFVADRFARALRHEAEWRLESRVVWPDGGVHWIATQGTVFRDPDGTPTQVVGLITDVTARKAAEAERERLLRDAEAARRAAEAANRAKSEFLAVMSHELRTPLNAIGGYAELMEMGIRGPVTQQQSEDLARIQRSQRHLLGLIAGVLDYSRVEAGAVTYRLSDVPVGEALAEAEALVAPQLRAKGLGYAWSGAPPDLCVRADREKLQQVLLNLLGNAVKFTDARGGVPGRIEVTCTVIGTTDDGPGAGLAAGDRRVHLHVRDTGAGIAAEKLAAVFEPFVQADQRLTRPQEGVGLGLAISRDLARGMGGDLTVESTPGVGSTFTLTLPRAEHPRA